jgi:hypothetical protein
MAIEMPIKRSPARANTGEYITAKTTPECKLLHIAAKLVQISA